MSVERVDRPGSLAGGSHPGARLDEMQGGGHTTVGVPVDPVITDPLDAAGPR
jgi:hypothetical protein